MKLYNLVELNFMYTHSTLAKVTKGKTIVEILKTFTIMHVGWEMDNYGWIVKLNNGKNVAVTTNHGTLKLWTTEEMYQKIQETQESLNGLKESLKLLS